MKTTTLPSGMRHTWRAAMFLALGALAGIPCARAAAEPRPGPNILFLYTDDLAVWGVGAYGHANAVTPQIDALARSGMLFERAFVTTPVCSPSRAGLLTGQHAFRIGITDFIQFSREPELGLSTRFVTWPALLRQRGYRTGLFGKWHLGHGPEYSPARFGFDEFARLPDAPGGSPTRDPVVDVNGEVRTFAGFASDVVADAAIAFLERHRDRPTVTSVHFREPHTPYGPVPEADDRVHRDRPLTLPEVRGLNRAWAEPTLRAYLKSVASVDRNVGRILAAVERLGLTERTLVVLTSDNGYLIGHNGVYGKGTATLAGADIRAPERRPNLFDLALRVPLVVRWPGVTRSDSRTPAMVTNLDLFPTLLAVGGARHLVPDGYPIPGHDLGPLLRGENTSWRRAIFADYDMTHYVVNSMRMIRTEDWKLVVHSNPAYGHELYDLQADPGETVNLAGQGRHFERLRELRARLYAWQEWMGDPKRVAPSQPQ